MATFVVDASVAVKWFVLETSSDRALALASSDSVLIAPDIARYEIAAALSRHAREGAISREQAERDILSISEYFGELMPSQWLLAAAVERSLTLQHHLYDCIYLVAALARNARLITADKKFAAKIAETPDAQNVVLLADWKP